MTEPLLQQTPAGLYCPGGDFYIDPWRPVPRAVVTHAHSDHARPGSQRYLCSTASEPFVRTRLPGADVEALPFGECRRLGQIELSLHPAGHILGSAQVRIESRGQVCVVTGDYKRTPDITCEPFEPQRCHHLVTEATFGLPVFHWPPRHQVADAMHRWWRHNQASGRTSVLLCYALGKAQRLLASLDPSIGPILHHGAMTACTEHYRQAGIALPKTHPATVEQAKERGSQALVLAPPSAANTSWLRRFRPASLAFASGWMMLRGTRRRRAVDRGFIVSDHADWEGLNQTVRDTGAERVWVMHGYADILSRWLVQQGLQAEPLSTPARSDGADREDDAASRVALEGRLEASDRTDGGGSVGPA